MNAQSFDQLLESFDYALPKSRIALTPASPRDSAKLLVFDRKTGETHWSTFLDLADFLPTNALLVFNETKVIPARLLVTSQDKKGPVEILITDRKGKRITAMANKKLHPDEELLVDQSHRLRVMAKTDRLYTIDLLFDSTLLDDLLDRSGHTPLPPYLRESPLTEEERRAEYQSIFAKNRGSIAAPTASLHFTERLMKKLRDTGIDWTFVTLHVNLGTFAPLTEEQWHQKKLHQEQYEIPGEAMRTIAQAKAGGRSVIAVGTTVVRTLEAAMTMDDGQWTMDKNATTDLFITEDYPLRVVDGLITNFHVPKSSLLMLVSAFVGREKLLDLYRQAIGREFRFFSFGDGMLIL